jgi:hypothetical protein
MDALLFRNLGAPWPAVKRRRWLWRNAAICQNTDGAEVPMSDRSVALLDIDRNGLERAERRLGKTCADVLIKTVDVSDRDQMRRSVDLA